MKTTEYKPNYAVHPSEIIADMALYELLGKEWANEIQNIGIKPEKAFMLAALFHCPKEFFINLQNNYEKDKKRIEQSEIQDNLTSQKKDEEKKEKAICQLCGEKMPEGEEMFNYHGYSGNCPVPEKKR